MFDDLVRKIKNIGIIPVVTLSDVNKSESIAQALIEGGLPIIEVTFRTDEAPLVIKRISELNRTILVGAGTVLTVKQAELALQAGAQFIVMPSFNRKVIDFCLSRDILPIPGSSCPSEVENGVLLDLPLLKYFPAEANGGLESIKALCGPYKNVDFIPTGGIDEDNLNKYLTFNRIAAVGGSFHLSTFINANDWSGLTEHCKKIVRKMLGVEIAHIGINTPSVEEAWSTAAEFSELLCLPVNEGSSSLFVHKDVEVMKAPYWGSMGHIAFKVHSVSRAVQYLTERGIQFKEETKKVDTNGFIKSIYLEREVAGFAIHLVGRN